MRVVAMIPAHNEEGCIEQTVLSLVGQTWPPDLIVVVCDNCSDMTAWRVGWLADQYPTVKPWCTHNNTHRKPGALNLAWLQWGYDSDLLVTMDADTVLAQNAIEDWVSEFAADPVLGGCSSRFTMLVGPQHTRWQRILVRLQKAEFARWTDVAHRRKGRTSVLAGTACCLRSQAVAHVTVWRTANDQSPDPWLVDSLTEDFELTYRMRSLGWTTRVSPTVRAYTDAMTSVRALWAQRMKWQVGTVRDLLHFGFNRYTWVDWWQQAIGMVAIGVRMLWLLVLVLSLAIGQNVWGWGWVVAPALFLVNDVKHSFRVPRRDRYDTLQAALLLPQEGFAWMRGLWFMTGWAQVLAGFKRDRWAMQAVAEGASMVESPGSREA